ncbi:SRPBCC family protein [Phytohabitans houttuyneae]|uniref:Activator of Hsp90 ATPase homologue 1/2-like C-terminal domain-containing protein n=1 Tax=Phytohabitans houttuyneae TaxID=1076126 RepID=A0A6V8KHP7_9ACTN|nr:SRPBCC domain-containing protein [Phytohabitans houttuyneae]GFJ81516.1 hypothetical protein Phou_056960 [Phytohabitans houttuyneae]
MSLDSVESTAPNLPHVDSWPDFSELKPEQAKAKFPPLNINPARSIVQDRWERLVAVAETPHDIQRVWEVLTGPDHVRHWLAVVRGTIAEVDAEFHYDFEDGEFFHCLTTEVEPPRGGTTASLSYFWRWVGVGPATRVRWDLAATADGTTRISATEESFNPPNDWRGWNGNGWPGILDQLAGYLRTGTTWRWPWRRMGPYVQIELESTPYDAWEMLSKPESLRYWLQRRYGSFATGDKLTLIMGDASGIVEMVVHQHVEPNQKFPSFLPWLEFGLKRASWPVELSGKLYIEHAGLNRALFQIFVDNWENLPADIQLEERKIIAGFFRDSMVRAQQMTGPRPAPSHPHGWS